jgi:hypothetical protein
MSDKKVGQPQIQPGQCPPGGCPPPDRIECIVVDKVYDSCFQIDERTREIETDSEEFGTGLEVGDVVECKLNGEISCNVISRTPVADGFFTLVLSITVPILLTNPEAASGEEDEIERTFTFSKTITLCAPEGVNIDCSESTLLSCNCVVIDVEEDEEEIVYDISCDIQVCLVIKSILRVQLLVPSYGFCVPAPCVTLPGVCPPLPPDQCF